MSISSKSLIEEFFTNGTVESIYYLDHDAVRLMIEENAVDFRSIP